MICYKNENKLIEHFFDILPLSRLYSFKMIYWKNMSKKKNYNINLDIKFGHQEKIDIDSVVAAFNEKWFNQTLTKINDRVLRIGIIEGEFHWHKHERDDEFFLVLAGRLYIDLEDRTIELGPNQGVTISKGLLHRPRAPQKTVMLMIETANIKPEGD